MEAGVGGPRDEDSWRLLRQARPCPGTGEVTVNSGGGPPGFSRVKEKTVQGLLSTRWLNFTAGVLSSLLPQKGRGKKGVKRRHRHQRSVPIRAGWAHSGKAWREGHKEQGLGRSLGETPGWDIESVLERVSLGRAQHRVTLRLMGVDLGSFQRKKNFDWTRFLKGRS